MSEVKEIKTIEEWSSLFGFEILDPDGFDRGDPELHERLFTKEEFEKNSAFSTIRFIEGDRAYHKPFNKMIRDNIPDIMMQENKICKLRRVTGDDYAKALKEKLLEEVMELIDAKDKTHILEEAGDVRDVLDALIANLSERSHFTRQADRKLHSKGGFNKGYILLAVVDK